MNATFRYVVLLVAGLVLVAAALAEDAKPDADEAPSQAPASEQPKQPASDAKNTEDTKEAKPPALPGVRIDREKRIVDLDATVVLREGDWLELLACMPGTREHESILTIPARPSHINLALIMIGLEPGTPMRNKLVDDKYVIYPPQGPKVSVHILYEVDGEQKEVAANEWIYDRNTEEPMKGNHWLFTGSTLFEHEGKTIFLADINGSILSLVNFGDDLLVRDTDLTPQTDGEILTAHTQAIPKVGTKVTIRLRPVEQEE